jgi:hypothetical protein
LVSIYHIRCSANDIKVESDDPQAFKRLALVLKWMKDLADPFRFRCIELSDRGPYANSSKNLMLVLLDDNHNLTMHVRHIIVSYYNGDKDWFKLD